MNKVDELIKTFKTNNPFELITDLGFQVKEQFLGKTTLGMTISTDGEKSVIINNAIINNQKLFVAAHELGHAVNDEIYSTTFLRKQSFGFHIPEIEANANRFAFQLLMYNMEPNECITTYRILDYFHLPYGMERFINPKKIHFAS